jgi:peroxiredoxin Q/BCP
MPQVNEKAPQFSLPDSEGNTFSLADQAGRKTLLVFYPGDNTPVCTKQLCDYRDGIEAFEGLGVDVVGISNDNAETHREFSQKHRLPFRLLTDADLEVAGQYDSKGLMGMKRSIFLVDETGVIRYRHVESVPLFRRKREELLEVIESLA